MVKKILASVLTLVMAMSIFTFGVSTLAYAAEADTAQEEVQAITASEALEIGLAKAGYKQTSVKYTTVAEDKEADGTEIYKVVFYVGPVEFGYHIDKATGEILKAEIND